MAVSLLLCNMIGAILRISQCAACRSQLYADSSYMCCGKKYIAVITILHKKCLGHEQKYAQLHMFRKSGLSLIVFTHSF